jgi:hypothetical protein
MKLKLLSIVLIIFMTQLVSSAAVSVDRTLSREYLMNNGYSKQIYDSVNVTRARALGQEYYSSEERAYKNMSPTKRFFRKLNAYIDPAVDDYSFYHHDISPEPNINDF